MSEVLLAGLLAISGAGMLAPWRRCTGSVAWATLAVPMAGAVLIVMALASFVTIGRVDAVVTMLGVGALGLAGFVAGARRFPPSRRDVALVVIIVAAAATVAGVAWTMHLTRLTPDSLVYLVGASDYTEPGAFRRTTPNYAMTRQFGVQAFHAMSDLTPRNYVASIGPLFGVSGIGFFGWLVASRVPGSPGRRALVVASAIGFMLAANRPLYDFFYINSHVQMAAFMLIAVAGIWLAILEDQPVWGLFAGVALAVTVTLRPEAPLFIAVVLVPFAVSRAGWRARWMVTVPILAVGVLWYGLVLLTKAPPGSRVPVADAVALNALVLVVSVAGVLFAGTGRMPRLVRFGAALVLPGLAAAAVVFSVMRPVALLRTLSATVDNLMFGQGLWMLAWPMLIALAAIALLIHRLPESSLWTRPIGGFALLYMVLPFLKGGSWRTGPGDSGNRILGHVFAIVLAFVILAFAATDRGSTAAAAPARSGERR